MVFGSERKKNSSIVCALVFPASFCQRSQNEYNAASNSWFIWFIVKRSVNKTKIYMRSATMM